MMHLHFRKLHITEENNKLKLQVFLTIYFQTITGYIFLLCFNTKFV